MQACCAAPCKTHIAYTLTRLNHTAYLRRFVCIIMVFIFMLPVTLSHFLIQVDDTKVHFIMPVDSDNDDDDDDEGGGRVREFDPTTDDIPDAWLTPAQSEMGIAVPIEEDANVGVVVPIAAAYRA